MDIVYEACRILQSVLQARAPYDTGNLAMNSIRIDQNRGCVIIGGEDIAPYAPFTNEPWVSPQWHGAKNPNEGWIQRAIQEALPLIQRVLSGRATDEDVCAAQNYYSGIVDERLRMFIENEKQVKAKIDGG